MEITVEDILTFGKYKGKNIKEVAINDKGYLIWLYNKQLISLRLMAEELGIEDLHITIQKYTKLCEDLQVKCKETYNDGYNTGTASTIKQFYSILADWRRQIVKEYHPDKRPNRSSEAMAALNDSYDKLVKKLAIMVTK